MRILSAVFRTIVGALFGLAAMLALTPAIAAIFDVERGEGGWSFVVALIGAALGLFAPTIRRAFGRGFLLLGSAVLALPLSMMLLSGKVGSEMMEQNAGSAAAAVGSGLAGVMATGLAAFVGFFLGAILLIIGLVLVLGGRREVIVVNAPVEPRW